MSRLLDNLLIFGRLLRRAGVDVHRGRLLDVVEALGHVNLGERDEVYHTCRALLVHRHEQIALFDLAFASFWREHHEGEARQRAAARRVAGVRGRDRGRPRAGDPAVTSGADEAEDDAPARDRQPEDLERPRRSSPTRTSPRSRATKWRKRPPPCLVSSGILVNAGHGDGFEGAARESIFDGRSPTACARAATW